MATLSFEDVIGRPIEDLEDAVIAQLARGFMKHAGETSSGAQLRAREEINSMSQEDFLLHLSMGLKYLKEHNLI